MRAHATYAAVAAFLHAAQLTPRQLRDNSTLVNALAREHVVPHVRFFARMLLLVAHLQAALTGVAPRRRWRFAD